MPTIIVVVVVVIKRCNEQTTQHDSSITNSFGSSTSFVYI